MSANSMISQEIYVAYPPLGSKRDSASIHLPGQDTSMWKTK